MTPIYVQPKTGSVWGTDISFYQDDNATPQQIDFAKMFAAGCAFTIIRAGQNLWQDQDFFNNWNSAKGIMPRGAYFYLDVRASIRQQAKILADALREDPGDLPPAIDFEQISTSKVNGEVQQLKISHLDGFDIYLKEYLPTVRTPTIYTGHYYWIEHGSTDIRFAKRRLWMARYGADRPLIPPPWKENEWTFWQFTDKGDGKRLGAESLNIDLNYFNGSVVQLYELAGWQGPIPNPEPTPGGKKRRMVIEGEFTVTEEP